MNSAILAGFVRHIVTGIAGLLIAKGIISEDMGGQIAELSAGVAMFIGGLIWSAKAPEKKQP